MTIPLLALLALAGPVVYDRAKVANRAASIARSVEVASAIGSLVQEMQLERLLAVGYRINQVDRPTLENQIDSVNTLVSKLLSGSAGTLSPDVRVVLGQVSNLGATRDAILTGQPVWSEVIADYEAQITGLIDALHLERGVDVGTAAGSQVVGLDAVLRADEEISSAAAMLVLLANNPAEPGLFLTYEATLTAIQTQSARFTTFCTPEQVALYNQLQTQLSTTLGTVTYAPGSDPRPMLVNFPLFQIFPSLQDFIRSGLRIETKISDDVTQTVAKQKSSALVGAYSVGAVVLIVLILVGLLSTAVARAVVRPLTRLTASAERVAKVAQAELVRVADDEVESSSVVHLDPVDVGANDEIGDLARAFEEVQGTAVQLVERQAVSRRNVAQMFGHVGRRTQNLVARQIALIDWLEREETDANRLQQLYRLDHVSSRLRRNAQSLVVLSGGEGANAHVNPLPLADIVRLALGEIEDYTRVDIEVPADLVIAPAAISDLVLVLAELMENATAFSPPHTRVTVFGQPLPHGAARLSVVDHGLGLTPERLAEENARLDRRERLDLTPTEVLGLFVVGRLSRRHSMAVALLSTAGGGVTATVQLPPELMIQPMLLASMPAIPASPPPTAVTGRVVARAAVLGAELDSPAEVVSRAIESVRTASAWNAFVPRQRALDVIETVEPLALSAVPASAPEAAPAPPAWPPAQPANGQPANGQPANGQPGDLRPINGASGTAAVPATAYHRPPPVQPMPPIPSVQPAQPSPPVARPTLPAPPVVAPAPPPPLAPVPLAWPAPEPAPAAWARPEPAASPTRLPAPAGGAPLHRRIPGVALDQARGDSQFPTANLNGQQADPGEVRDLVEQFEAGIFRALSEVRHNSNPREEGPTR